MTSTLLQPTSVTRRVHHCPVSSQLSYNLTAVTPTRSFATRSTEGWPTMQDTRRGPSYLQTWRGASRKNFQRRRKPTTPASSMHSSCMQHKQEELVYSNTTKPLDLSPPSYLRKFIAAMPTVFIAAMPNVLAAMSEVLQWQQFQRHPCCSLNNHTDLMLI
jgi:hypothetical protein